ncbi:MAG: CheB methylesterase [Phycisphaerales bacterium]|nr:CheB methylesterase [Phycisphaerales bacterium]
MPGHDLIVIGGSAGATEALQKIVGGLPAEFPAAVLVTVHTAPTGPGLLADILDRCGPLRAQRAKDGEPIVRGRIYVAPPDFHLLVDHRHIRLFHGPRENGFRPAIDPLFRSAAGAAGPRTVGVVLSGGLDDGTEGLMIIKRHHGTAIVQDPADAQTPSMPQNAIDHCNVDRILPAAQIAAALVELAHSAAPEAPAIKDDAPDVAEVGEAALRFGRPADDANAFTCPECGGALPEVSEGKLRRFQCHVGHRYSEHTLLAAQNDAVESALWAGVRALEEAAALRRRLARGSDARWPRIVQEYERQAKEAEHRAAILRGVVLETQNGKARGAVEPPRDVTPHASSPNGSGRVKRKGKRTAASKRG